MFCSDGKLSRVGPGYDINRRGEIVITNRNLYHEHVKGENKAKRSFRPTLRNKVEESDKVITKEKKPVKITQKIRQFLLGHF